MKLINHATAIIIREVLQATLQDPTPIRMDSKLASSITENPEK
jgi:hypothetical protein